MKTFWLSFVSTETHKNIGCCIIDANDPEDAAEKSKELGINPGGEIAIFEIPSDAVDLEHFEKNMLIPRERLERFGYQRMGNPDEGHTMKCPPDVTVICEECNEGGSNQ